MNQKTYSGSAYIGVAGGETEIGIARDSIERIQRRPEDGSIVYCRATKGYEARQKHFNNFIESKHDFLLMLDHDMVFEPFTLERLRSHGLPYVSGLYMRRTVNPLAPIWFRPWTGRFPYEPWIGDPERGKLHPIGASGWGCVLIHREVVLAVRQILKGEYDVLEDDMDVWPYDLKTIVRAINGLNAITRSKPEPSILYPALEAHVMALTREFRPLRADREQIGSDIRYPFFALRAGYQLMGDPEVRPGHLLQYSLTANDYQMPDPAQKQKTVEQFHQFVSKERARLAKQKREIEQA